MSLSPPNSLFSIPSGSLQISEISSAISERIRFSLMIFTYNVGVFIGMTLLYLLSDPTTLSLPLTCSKIIASKFAINQ